MDEQSTNRSLLVRAGRVLQQWLMRYAGLRVERVRRRSKRSSERVRYDFQRRFIAFDIPEGAAVLDVGSGGDPFPFATTLVDRYVDQTHHRHAPLIRDSRRFVEADIADLPFADDEFEFVYCAHVLEHVPDPIAACRELMRVGRRGYIETPTLGKDVLFAWNVPEMHKWHVVAIADQLCFFELSPRQSEGVRSKVWRELILGKWEHPLQDMYFDNEDLFNVMFLWHGGFTVQVFRLDGTHDTYAPPARAGSAQAAATPCVEAPS